MPGIVLGRKDTRMHLTDKVPCPLVLHLVGETDNKLHDKISMQLVTDALKEMTRVPKNHREGLLIGGRGLLKEEVGRPTKRLLPWSGQQMTMVWIIVVAVEREGSGHSRD